MKTNTKIFILILAAIVVVVGGILLTTRGTSLLGNFSQSETSPATGTEFAIIHPVADEEKSCSETKKMQFDITNPSDQTIQISRIGFYFQGEGFQNFAISEIQLSPLNKSFSYPAESSLQEKSIAYFDLSPQTLTNTGRAPLTIAPKTTKSILLSWKGNATVIGLESTGEFQVAPAYAKYGDAFAPTILPNGLQPLETIFISKQNTWTWTPFTLCE